MRFLTAYRRVTLNISEMLCTFCGYLFVTLGQIFWLVCDGCNHKCFDLQMLRSLRTIVSKFGPHPEAYMWYKHIRTKDGKHNNWKCENQILCTKELWNEKLHIKRACDLVFTCCVDDHALKWCAGMDRNENRIFQSMWNICQTFYAQSTKPPLFHIMFTFPVTMFTLKGPI